MTAGANYPKDLNLTFDSDEKRIQLLLNGVSLFGAVYCDDENNNYYRVIVMDENLDIQTKKNLQDMISKDADGFVPVKSTETAYCGDNNKNYFVIRYDAGDGALLAWDVLKKDTLSYNIQFMSKLCTYYEIWQQKDVLPLVITPFDIVKSQDKVLFLPYFSGNRTEDLLSVLFDNPLLTYFLPKEVIKDMHTEHRDKSIIHQYIIGVMILMCFFNIPESDDTVELIHQGVMGDLSCALNELKVPEWQVETKSGEKVISLARKMTDGNPQKRGTYNVASLGKMLRNYIEMLNPDKIIEELRQNSPEHALMAVTDMLKKEDNEHLRIIAGDIYGDNQNFTMAVDEYEKAYSKGSGAALQKQFNVICENAGKDNALSSVIEGNLKARKYYTNIVKRNYNSILKTSDAVLKMCEYSLWVNKINNEQSSEEIVQFVAKEFKDIKKQTTDFATCKLGVLYLSLLAEAKDKNIYQHLMNIKNDMIYIRQKNLAPIDDIKRLGAVLSALESRLN